MPRINALSVLALTLAVARGVFAQDDLIVSFSMSDQPGLDDAVSVDELIEQLAVEEPGSETANTAQFLLKNMGNDVVGTLTAALEHEDRHVRFRVVQTLGAIGTSESRAVLIRAAREGAVDVRRDALRALLFRPHPDAEQVYLEAIDSGDNRFVREAVAALGEIESSAADAPLQEIVEGETGWRTYYTAVRALRKIRGGELPPELSDAVGFLQRSKYEDVTQSELDGSARVLEDNFDVVLPDVVDVWFFSMKANESQQKPDASTLIARAGVRAWPHVRRALRDSNNNIRSRALELIEALGAAGEFEDELRRLAAEDENAGVRREAGELLMR